ncbi:MAG: TIGR03619 family F420-dependent LLM class oxidoreductase [Alphaproteobacteria bacterium]|nr:TIGR03619 family F420-dependent LLM class oxidoreductase [Alphaproteobacteria bacterium]
MKLGIVFINAGARSGQSIIDLATRAEAAGVESVWTGEHVMIPVEYDSPYPYNENGRMGVPPETNLVDPLITLAAVAAATKKVRLGTGVNILPQSNPLLLAKQAASLDFISGGRLMLGMGIGWLKEEFDAMGVPFERRGARFDDYVQAMRKVWSGEVVEHRSEFLDWHGFKSYPLPVQNPLPVVIGGDKGKAFERIAKYGNGWYTPRPTLDEVLKGRDAIVDACGAVGRDPAEIEITAMWHMAAGLDTVRRYEDAGIHRMLVPVMGRPDDTVDQVGEAIAKLS